MRRLGRWVSLVRNKGRARSWRLVAPLKRARPGASRELAPGRRYQLQSSIIRFAQRARFARPVRVVRAGMYAVVGLIVNSDLKAPRSTGHGDLKKPRSRLPRTVVVVQVINTAVS